MYIGDLHKSGSGLEPFLNSFMPCNFYKSLIQLQSKMLKIWPFMKLIKILQTSHLYRSQQSRPTQKFDYCNDYDIAWSCDHSLHCIAVSILVVCACCLFDSIRNLVEQVQINE